MLDGATMVEKMDRAGVRRVVLIPSMNDPLPDTPDRLLWVLRKLSQRKLTRWFVERVHRSTMTADGNLRLYGKVTRIYARPDNEAVASFVATQPSRFWGWVFLNPKNADVLDTLEAYRTRPGIIGIKLHPHWHDYPIELVLPVVRRARELRLPLLVHFGFGTRGNVESLVEAAGDGPVISAHAGFPFYRDIWKLGSLYRNLYVDLSSPYIDESLARRAVSALGEDRCVYGTDAPYGFHEQDGSYDYSKIKGWVFDMPLSSRGVERVLSTNFLELIERSA